MRLFSTFLKLIPSVSILFHIGQRLKDRLVSLKASPSSFTTRQSLGGNCYGPVKGPIHLKSTPLEPRYKISSRAKSKAHSLLIIIFILNLELT